MYTLKWLPSSTSNVSNVKKCLIYDSKYYSEWQMARYSSESTLKTVFHAVLFVWRWGDWNLWMEYRIPNRLSYNLQNSGPGIIIIINIHLLKNPAVNNVKYWVNLKPHVNTLATKWLQFVMLSKLIGKKPYKLTFAAFAVRYYMYYDWKIWISGF